jgi:dTDP-4-dehydrorhamnose reductase
MKKKIYIAGCGGMLGDAFYHTLKQSHSLKCTDIDVNEEWLTYLDFRDFEAYREDVLNFEPDYLFHLGAFTDLEYCEENEEESYVTNTLSVENAVHIANELDIPLLYISTAGIFDGKKELYDDWDDPNPLGVYARTKYLGERYVLENARKYFACRAGWMMGGGRNKDKKFINKLVKQIDSGAEKLFIVNDKMGTPTYTFDFANNVKALVETPYYGIYNMVCEGVTDRLEVAQELVKLLGLTDKISIEQVDSGHFKKEYYAPRPPSERLVNRRLTMRGLNLMTDWRVALKAYIERCFQNEE